MSDLISRKWLIECVEEGWIKFDTEKDKNKFIHLVRDTAPSADAVEVVRCKDCKYASPNGAYGCRLERFSEHDKSERLFAEDYCSVAERKEK